MLLRSNVILKKSHSTVQFQRKLMTKDSSAIKKLQKYEKNYIVLAGKVSWHADLLSATSRLAVKAFHQS